MNEGADLLAEQRERWEGGDRAPVESYLAARPDIPAELVKDLIYQEVVLREESGQRPSLGEYQERFPAFAAELALQFEVHEAFALDPTEALVAGTPRRPVAPARTRQAPSIPGYEILGPIGQGGMGVVFAAEQRSLGRRVAVKLLPPEASRDAESLRRFQNEARAASSLNHPHICTIIDFGSHDGQPFLVMELVEGRTLAALLDEGAAPRAVEIVRQIAEALSAAHAAGVVHRDIKPANVMVRDDGHVKVLDFGLARLVRGMNEGGETGSGVLVGTPRYMSPEQVRGEAAGPPSDVFSLGIVLYESLTGKHPFAAPTVLGSLAAVESHAPAVPSAESPTVSPGLDALVLRMLDKRAEDRPTMAEVVAALAADSSVRDQLQRSEIRSLPGTRKPPWLRMTLLAALVAVVAPLAWLLARRPAPPPRAPTPSIVVLPFTPVGDASQAHWSAGVTEDITSMLARAPDIAVLSNGAALAYKDKPADARRIGSELGVAYVLEGTVRKEDDKVRIVAQLIDARTGLDVWSERFDRAGADPWALQDEIAGKIVGALTGEYGQIKRAQYRAAWGTDSTRLDEYDHYLRGHELYMRLTPADNERAGEVWRAGLVVYPDSALLQAKLGFYHFMRPFLYLEDGAETDYARAGALARSALGKPHLSPLERRLAHWLFAYVSAQEGDHDRALREVDTTLSLAPYDVFQGADLSTMRILAGQPEEAIFINEKAMSADPANRAFYQQLRGWALTVAGRHAESVTALGESIDLPVVPLLQAINYVRLGRPDDARRQVEKARAMKRDVSLSRWRSANFYRDRAVVEGQVRDLEAAGLR